MYPFALFPFYLFFSVKSYWKVQRVLRVHLSQDKVNPRRSSDEEGWEEKINKWTRASLYPKVAPPRVSAENCIWVLAVSYCCGKSALLCKSVVMLQTAVRSLLLCGPVQHWWMGAQGLVFARQSNSHWPATLLKKDTSHPFLIHWADVEGRAIEMCALVKVERLFKNANVDSTRGLGEEKKY